MRDFTVVFYNGFSEPEHIKFSDVEVHNNYLGDITDEVLEYYKDIKTWVLDDIIENQPLSSYGLWINPTLQQLQQFNKSVMLNEDDYLQDF